MNGNVEKSRTQSMYLFCPFCASKWQKKDKWLYICENCDYHHYINATPNVSLIIQNEKDEILFAVRGIDPHQGMLDLPGGFVQVGESLESSLAREMREELGFDVKELSYIGSYTETYLQRNFETGVVVTFFSTVINQELLIPTDDIEAVRWIHHTKIPIKEISFESNIFALQDFFEDKKWPWLYD